MPRHAARKTRFIAEYPIDLDARAAAIRAGYAAASAKTTGWRLLKQPAVAAAIAENARRKLAGFEVTADRVLRTLAHIAFADVRELYRPDETLKDIVELDEVTAAGIEAVEVVAGNRWRVAHVTRFDKLAVLTPLARRFGLLGAKRPPSRRNTGESRS